MLIKKLAQGVSRMLLIVAAFAVTSTAELSAHTVPFLGQGQGQDLAVIPQADGIRISAVVEGQATHLGHFIEKLDYVLAYDLVHFAGTGAFTAAWVGALDR